MSSSRPCQVHLTVVKGACLESSSLLGVWQNRPHWGLAAWPVGCDCCSSRSGRGRNTVMQAVIMATEMGQAQDLLVEEVHVSLVTSSLSGIMEFTCYQTSQCRIHTQ